MCYAFGRSQPRINKRLVLDLDQAVIQLCRSGRLVDLVDTHFLDKTYNNGGRNIQLICQEEYRGLIEELEAQGISVSFCTMGLWHASNSWLSSCCDGDLLNIKNLLSNIGVSNPEIINREALYQRYNKTNEGTKKVVKHSYYGCRSGECQEVDYFCKWNPEAKRL